MSCRGGSGSGAAGRRSPIIRRRIAATRITTNRAYRDWPTTFANDATLASAILDRLLHHCTTIRIENHSYRRRQRAD